MNKPSTTTTKSRARPQFRHGSMMAFTTGLCVFLAVMAALGFQPLPLLVVGVLFSIGVAVVAAQFELLMVVTRTRERQRHGVGRHD